jgi:hypothetical protein
VEEDDVAENFYEQALKPTRRSAPTRRKTGAPLKAQEPTPEDFILLLEALASSLRKNQARLTCPACGHPTSQPLIHATDN